MIGDEERFDRGAGDDGFDADLAVLFEQAAPPLEDTAFTEAVTARLNRGERLRLWALGGAALAGAGLAGSQLGGVISGPMAALADLAGAGVIPIGPQLAGTVMLAALVLAVAWIVPTERISAL